MDFTRINKAIHTAGVRHKRVCLVGCGGAAGLARHLARCGVQNFTLYDKDTVGGENLCRQEHMADQVGVPKAEALAAELRRINPEASIRACARDFTTVTDEEAEREFGGVPVMFCGRPGRLLGTDLFIAATDSHAAQARVNQIALMLGVPAVFIGAYEGGAGGEVFHWRPGLDSCYRCCCSARYAAQEAKSFDPPSDGATVLDVTLIDSIAGQIAVGLLTEGADNRYGRLIGQLGDRQFLQIKIDPQWNWNGRDVVREQLGVPEGNDAFFSYCAIARRDPDPGGNCPDCLKYRKRC